MITQGVDAVLSAVRPILSRWWRHHRRHVEEDSKVRLGRLKRFSLQELQVATDNFSKKNIVGVGGFGKVYIGKLADSSLVAVKRILGHSSYGQKEFQAEVDMINYIGFHRNILRLIGFCRTAKERFLVYPFMANDNLASHLRGYSSSKPPLDWPTRMRIALGSARGLSFLHEHCNPKIIHRDIKPSNIFLNEEFEAALGHFWLAIQMDVKDEYVITDVCGAIGYIAPEYMLQGKSSEKSDVFQYGITLLELITGRRAFSFFTRLEPDVLQDWVKGLMKDKRLDKLIDPDLQNNYVETEVEFLIRVALLCTQGSPVDRPRMSEIVRMLEGEGLAERWQEWQDLEVAQVTQQDQHLQAASPYGNNYSNYNHSAIELSGPR